MKKMILMAAAAVTMFASCSKDADPIEPGDKVLSVTLANAPANSGRAIEAPTSNLGLIVLDGDGIIFITDQTGTVKRAIPFDPAFPGSQPTQVISGVVSTDKVFVVANIGTDNITNRTTLNIPANVAAINSLIMSIENPTYGQTYSTATLSNSNNLATPIVVTGSTATVSVPLNPAYSRLELKNVVGANGPGDGDITSFDVVGVYVDDYHTNYTIGGSFNGPAFEIGQQTSFATISVMENEGTWSSVAQSATSGASTAWVYSVPSGNVPRLIIKVNNIVGKFDTGVVIPNNQTYFLSVSSYTSFSDVNFLRGKVYHINNLTFQPSNLNVTPNPQNVDLTVELAVSQWQITNIGTVLD